MAAAHLLLARPRLLISILVGIAVGVLLPRYFSELRGVTRLLVGWDVGVGLYLILAFWMIAHSTVADIQRQYLLQDEGGFAILVLTIVSARGERRRGVRVDRDGDTRRDFLHARPRPHVADHCALLGLHPHHVRAALRA